jgi:hypothetical protein
LYVFLVSFLIVYLDITTRDDFNFPIVNIPFICSNIPAAPEDRDVLATSGTYPGSFVTQIFRSGQPSHGGDRNIVEVMTSSLPKGTLGSVASLLAATLSFVCFSCFFFNCLFRHYDKR